MNENLLRLDFKVDIPQPIESRNTSSETYVRWGLDNQYGNYLVSLYEDSSTHSGIINKKTSYLIGNGMGYEDNRPIDIEVNSNDNIIEFVNKIVLDYFVFGCFAVETTFNVFGKPIEYHHIPYSKIRMNKDKNKFWYNEDWKRTSTSSIVFDRYSPTNNQDAKSKIFFYDSYFLSNQLVYPSQEYRGSVKSITNDICIKDFHLQNIQGRFSPMAIISFHEGKNLSEDQKRQKTGDINNRFTGTQGTKYMLEFLDRDGKKAEVTSLTMADWDKAYLATQESVIADIMQGHGVQNAQLFGVQTPGKLGNTQELEISFNIFKSDYIANKRRELERVLNRMFLNFEKINGKIKFLDKPLYEQDISDSIKEKIFTINEMRKSAGLEPLPNGDRLLNEPAQQAPVPVQQEEQAPSEKKKTDEELYELIKDYGVSADEFEMIEELAHTKIHFSKEGDISQYILDNDMKGLTLDELVKVLKAEGKITTTSSEVDDVLSKMKDAGLINIESDSKGRLSIKPLPKPEIPDTGKITTMYKYIKKPDVIGPDLIPTSRPLCVKLISNARLYTREDIQSMTALFGWDIKEHSGGWWYDPIEDVLHSSCRHTWQAVKVKRKE